MTPLPAEAVRARTRPFAIAAVYVSELSFALLVATPFHAWARRVWGEHPAGDAVLWLPSGRALVVWLGQEDAAMGVVSRTALVLLLVSAVAMQIPLGALLASLAFGRGGDPGSDAGRPPRWQAALRVGARSFLPLAGVLVLGSLAGLLVLSLGSLAASAVDRALAERLGDARSFQLRVVTFALFGLIAAAIGVVVDLARAAIVREEGLAALRGSVAPSWRTMARGLCVALAVAVRRRDIVHAVLAWGWRAGLSLALVSAGSTAAQALGGKGGGALLLLWVVHQGIVLARIALRASWLARAVAFVAPVQDARNAAHPEPSAAPGAPPSSELRELG